MPINAVTSCGTLMPNIIVLRSAGFGSATIFTTHQAATPMSTAFASGGKKSASL